MLSNWIGENYDVFEGKNVAQLCTSSSQEILPALVISHFAKNVEVVYLCELLDLEGNQWHPLALLQSKQIPTRFILWNTVRSRPLQHFDIIIGANLFVDLQHEMDVCDLISSNFEGKENGDAFITFQKELTCTDAFFERLEKDFEPYVQELQSFEGKELTFCQFTKK